MKRNITDKRIDILQQPNYHGYLITNYRLSLNKKEYSAS